MATLPSRLHPLLRSMTRLGARFALALVLVSTAQAQEPGPPATAVLGKLSFPTSTASAPAQAAFVEGMLLLHLFEYRPAMLAFQRAAQLDPDFAMAYWGEAMTHTHPVWNQQDLAAGRAALAKLGATPELRLAKARLPVERAFLQVAEILYGEGSKLERDQRMLQAMETMAKQFPEDDEAQLFLSLSLLAVTEGVRDLPNFLRAADIARAVYRRNPLHPGAAHYWIHGMDDPVNAAGALEAARALSKIAPDAGHSLHMTSHIFVALGLWDDVVASNEAASRVVNATLKAKAQPTYSCGHYSEWLQYAYFQQGRERDGFQLLLDCQRDGRAALAWLAAHPGEVYLSAKSAAALRARINWSQVSMRATAIVDSPRYRAQAAAIDLDISDVGRYEGWALFSRALAQVWSGDLRRGNNALVRIRAIAALPAEAEDNGTEGKYLAIMAQMLDGLIRFRSGDPAEGIGRVRAAAEAYEAMPFDFGPPATVKPPRELLGEMLLEQGKRAEALVEFDRALKSAPKRALSLAGRERALAR